jgi:hypothetical protein
VGGEYFAFDMCETVSIDGINLLTAPVGSPDITDVPASYDVYVSTDGVNWGAPVASSPTPPSPQAIIPFTATTVRYVLLMQTGVSPLAENLYGIAASWWSIHEISPICP